MEEPSGCAAVPPRRDVHVDHLAVLIHGPVDIPPTAGDLDVSLIDLPSGPNPVPGTAGSFGQDWREPLDPPVDSDVVDLHSAFGQQLFNIAIRESIT